MTPSIKKRYFYKHKNMSLTQKTDLDLHSLTVMPNITYHRLSKKGLFHK